MKCSLPFLVTSVLALVVPVMALAQEEGAANTAEVASKPIPKMEPLAWIIGDWEHRRMSPVGELQGHRRLSCSWEFGGRAIRFEWHVTNAEGKEVENGVGHYYLSPVTRELASWSIGRNFVVGKGRLLNVGNNELTWEREYTVASGNRALYKVKQTYKPDTDSFVIGWAKVSGEGPGGLGPWEYKRVEEGGKSPATEDDVPDAEDGSDSDEDDS